MEVREISHHAGYFVSEEGKVFSQKYGRRVELKQSEHKGYRRVALSQNNKRTQYPVHRLVAEAFIPNPDEKPFVNHIDGNKRGNHWKNLQWCTASENQKHAYDVLNVRNGHTGYNYAKLYPNEELRNRLVELGVPRWRHNLAELGEMLPDEIEVNEQSFWLIIERGFRNEWCVAYRENGTAFRCFVHNSDTEADARAKMLIYLIENNLISLHDGANPRNEYGNHY